MAGIVVAAAAAAVSSALVAIRMIEQAGGVSFGVKVAAGSSRDGIVGELGDVIKIAVRAPPQGGAANAAVVALVAEALGLPAKAIQITRGHGNPRKQIFVAGLSGDEVTRRLSAARR